MALTRVRAVPAGFINPDDDRKMWGGIVPREGLFPDPVTTAAAGIVFAGTGWGVSARPFVAALRRGSLPFATTYGTAQVANDGVVANAWTIAAAPSSGSRIDRLCIRARDTTQGDSTSGAPTDGPGGATRTGFAEFVVVPGTPGTPGVAPALPAGYEELGQVTVSSGNASAAAASYAHTYDFAHVIGGTMYFRTTAALLNYTTSTALVPGMQAVPLDAAGFFFIWDGSRWNIGGRRPAIALYPAASGIMNNATTYAGWGAPGTGASRQSYPATGNPFFSYLGDPNGAISVTRAGRYNIRARLSVGNLNGGAMAFYLIKNNSAAAADILSQDTVIMHSSFGTMVKVDADDVLLAANDNVRLWCAATSGGSNLGVGGSNRSSGEFFAELVELA